MRPLAACLRLALILSFGIATVSPSLPQAKSGLQGVVVGVDGAPLAGVSTYDVWKDCCPHQEERVTSNEKGEFLLEHPGTVIHFSKANLRPLTVVVKPGTAQIRVMMTAADDSLTVPTCVKPGSDQKKIGWSEYGVHFTVPKDGVKLLGGKPDVDYLRYVIEAMKGGSLLELWFGPYAMSWDPDNELFIKSAKFIQRNLISTKPIDSQWTYADAGVVGRDSWGQMKDGSNWRQTGTLGSGATYKGASKEDARLFDQIINSICVTSHPKPADP